MPKSPKVGCCLRYLFRQVGGGLGITWEGFVKTGGHLTTSPHITESQIFAIYDNTINEYSCKYWTSTELCNTRAKNGTFPVTMYTKQCFCPKRQLFVKKKTAERQKISTVGVKISANIFEQFDCFSKFPTKMQLFV